MFRLYCLIIGYFFGCLQFPYIVSKIVGKIDIREHGSGNAGTTNVSRTLGGKIGLVVFWLDVLKVVCAYFLCRELFQNEVLDVLPGMYAGVGVVIGHNFPFFLRFKGGKGIASSLGLYMCVTFVPALISYALGFCVLLYKKYVSLAGLSATVIFPVMLLLYGFSIEPVLICVFISAMAIFQHRSNIDRIIHGTERRVGVFDRMFKKKR